MREREPSYPPEYDEPDNCLVCGLDVSHRETPCVCPECPFCAEVGNPDCYRDGHLVADRFCDICERPNTDATIEYGDDGISCYACSLCRKVAKDHARELREAITDPGDDERGDTILLWIVVLAVIWIPALFFIGAVVFLNLARK